MRASTTLVIRGGLFAGLLGYAIVVVYFAAANLVAGRSLFHTAALLGSAMFFGLKDPATLTISAAPILSFNLVHLAAFMLVGFVASWLVGLAERYPLTQYMVLIVLILVAFHLYAAMLLYALPLLGPTAWWEIGLASVLAAVGMGWYLLRLHPALRQELHDIPMGEVPRD